MNTEKLELKHLTPYLDYELKLKNRAFFHETLTLNGLLTDNGQDYILSRSKDIDGVSRLSRYANEGAIKPILRPLSDLIFKSGYHFIWDSETDSDSIEKWLELDNETMLGYKFSYEFWNILFENHFDVFGLIEKGLAIDINTLNK